MSNLDVDRILDHQLAGVTPADARTELAILKASDEFWKRHDDGRHPGHALAVRAWQRLHQLAASEET